MEEIKIQISSDIKNELEKMATKNGLSLKRFCEIILSLFPEDGKIYSGIWASGGKGAKRLIVDWPKFSSPVITLKKDELT
ncbi:MAG: hypothetical protein ACTSVK_17245 [Promethearchaeota archaeon]